jgi:hypothetical protein
MILSPIIVDFRFYEKINFKYKAGILAVVKGKWIIFNGELAKGPQPQPRARVYLGNSLD